MPDFHFKSRVAENSSSEGEDDFVLDGAIQGCQDFTTAGYTDGQLLRYVASIGNHWETGLGTYEEGSPRALLRTTVRESSNGGAKVDFPPGVKEIAVAPDAGDFNKLFDVNGNPVAGKGYSARTANTQLGLDDHGKVIEITANSFTQTFAAVATLGNGWRVIVYNSGSGDITLDPNSSEQIDGMTSFIMYPGEARLITCDGSALRSVVLKPFYRAWTATAAAGFTKPPGYQRIDGLIWGGGGSGGKNNTNAGGGGGGGACSIISLETSVIGATENITVGASVAGVTGTNAGNAGNDSSFGTLVTAEGGGPGGSSGSNNQGEGGGGGGLTGGPVTSSTGGPPAGGAAGSGGGAGGDSSFGGGGGGSITGGKGGATVYGGGGGGGASATVPGAGGKSVYGGGGGGGGGATNGGAAGLSTFGGSGGAGNGSAGLASSGSIPSGGGGGGGTGTSGAGARGELRLWGVV